MAVDPDRPGHVVAADFGYTERVVGVVSADAGLLLQTDTGGLRPELLEAAHAAYDAGDGTLGKMLEQQWLQIEAARTDRVLVSFGGQARVRVDGSGGAVRAGDFLGLSGTPGVATLHYGVGPVIGVALESWSGQTETLEIFVQAEHGLPQATSGRLAPVVGQAVMRAGTRRTTVEQVGLAPDSLAVVTFYGDPGSRHWIAARGYGYLVVELAEPAQADTPFGFHVVEGMTGP